nr:hypothetical protein [Tanacetum cinerariifolium]
MEILMFMGRMEEIDIEVVVDDVTSGFLLTERTSVYGRNVGSGRGCQSKKFLTSTRLTLFLKFSKKLGFIYIKELAKKVEAQCVRVVDSKECVSSRRHVDWDNEGVADNVSLWDFYARPNLDFSQNIGRIRNVVSNINGTRLAGDPNGHHVSQLLNTDF